MPLIIVDGNNFLLINNICTTKKHGFMKKFFTIAALAATMCGAVQAQENTVSALYVAGATGTEVNGQVLGNWDIANAVEVKLTDGKFVLKLKNFSTVGISAAKTSSWGVWDDNLVTFFGAVELVNSDLGTPFPLGGPGKDNGGGNLTAPWTADEWTVEIAGDLSTITFNTTTPGPDARPLDEVHLLGDAPIGWSPLDEYKFENEEGTKVFWLDIPQDKAIAGPIKNLNIILNGSWDTWWGGATKPLVFNEPQMWIWGANAEVGDCVIPAGTSYWGTIRFVRPFLGETAEVTMYTEIVPHKTETVSTGIEALLTDEDATPEYFTLQGLRVGSPQQGQIYIVRQGSKVSKVYYR